MHGSPPCTTAGEPAVHLDAVRDAAASAGNAAHMYLMRLRLEAARGPATQDPK